ncbi:putative RDD family membrane protein YckC [Planomicrobium sp. HSC-17F08]|nr:putative RDD family membrane protein YckC [Planomicrobium sp. HSC-17F08]
MNSQALNPPASVMRRFKALLYDYLLIFIYLSLLLAINVLLFPSLQGLFNGSLAVAQFSGFLMVTLPVSLYFIVSDSTLFGQSFGKKKMGIRVVDRNGKPLPVFRSAFRTALKFLPWELSHYLVYRLVYLGDAPVPVSYSIIGGIVYALMFAYLLTALFTRRKQSLYDLIAATAVIQLAGK